MDNECNNHVFRYASERTIVLSGDVDDKSAGDIISDIRHFNFRDRKRRKEKKGFKPEPIRIYIQSYGGYIYDAWGLVDAILTSKTPVYTYCFRYAMSAGLLVFLAGHKRYASQHATFLLHQISARQYGTYQNIVEEQEELDRMQSDLEKFVEERTKIPRKEIREVRKRKKNMYIHSEDFRRLGIADRFVEEE